MSHFDDAYDGVTVLEGYLLEAQAAIARLEETAKKIKRSLLDEETTRTTTKTWVLFGTADRDPSEHVMQVFESQQEAFAFVCVLPGSYHLATAQGIDYDSFGYEIQADITGVWFDRNVVRRSGG